MHIPPGRNIYNNQAFWRKSALKEFINIINKYPNDIVGIVTSHTHQEEIKILKTKDFFLIFSPRRKFKNNYFNYFASLKNLHHILKKKVFKIHNFLVLILIMRIFILNFIKLN